MKCNINSLYICVQDMNRAITFYENFFEQKVTVRDDVYSVFDICGFRFGLFAYKNMKEEHVYGSNCLPSISVESLEVLMNKTQGLKLCFPLTKISSHWVVEFIDSEGNHIELTAPFVDGEDKSVEK